MATTAISYVILICLAARASSDIAIFYNVYVAVLNGDRTDVLDAYDTVIRAEYGLEFPPAGWIALEIMKLARFLICSNVGCVKDALYVAGGSDRRAYRPAHCGGGSAVAQGRIPVGAAQDLAGGRRYRGQKNWSFYQIIEMNSLSGRGG